MFPTLFAMGVKNLGPHTKRGSSFMIMAIVGGALLPYVMGLVADHSSTAVAYLLPMGCFVIVAVYARSALKKKLIAVLHKKIIGAPHVKSRTATGAKQDPLAHPALFVALMFAMAIIDRSNIGFAKHAFQADTGLSNAAFALGAGIFFIGYAVFEVPSNLMLHKIGARIWLSRIMVTWGLVSASILLPTTNQLLHPALSAR